MNTYHRSLAEIDELIETKERLIAELRDHHRTLVADNDPMQHVARMEIDKLTRECNDWALEALQMRSR